MEPNVFGPFLKEVRTQRGLTQAQLAGRLHVSTAAVSKWERGKCLPDIAKIEDIAQALDLSVLEVMKCEILPEALPEEDLKLVYTETLQTARRQSRRRIGGCVWAAVCIAALFLLLHYFPIYHIAMVWAPSYYETGEVTMLAYIGSREDRGTARLILEQAEEAFSDLTSTKEEAKEKYGSLSRYSNLYEAVEESHSLKLWSARFTGARGSMWVFYSREGKDAEGNLVSGSWRVPSLWTVEKDRNGEWRVVGIKEHP